MPVAAAMMIGQGMNGLQGLMQYGNARKQYKADSKIRKQNIGMINENMRATFADQLLQSMQELTAMRSLLEDQARENLMAQGTATAMSAEAGVHGNSVDALQRDIAGQAARGRDRIGQQRQMSLAVLARERMGTRRNARAQIMGLNRPTKPNMLAHALNTGGQMAQTHMAYKAATGT